MSALAGLVNYSDDDDESSSEKEISSSPGDAPPSAGVAHDTKEPEKEKRSTTPDMAPPPSTTREAQPAGNPIHHDNVLSDEHRSALREAVHQSRRRRALLTPKPIDGVDNWGIPPEPTTECCPERAARIAHFLSLRTSGHRLNDHLQKKKDFHNPRIYAKLVEFVEVDEVGSNFPKEEFNPHGFPPAAYIDGIREARRQQKEAQQLALHQRSHVDFVSSESQDMGTSVVQNDDAAALAAAKAAAASVSSRVVKSSRELSPPRHSESRKRSSGHRYDRDRDTRYDRDRDSKRHYR